MISSVKDVRWTLCRRSSACCPRLSGPMSPSVPSCIAPLPAPRRPACGRTPRQHAVSEASSNVSVCSDERCHFMSEAEILNRGPGRLQSYCRG
ncbi:hypothetical protein FQN60_015454, partial [Etheostoma spectabile]